MRMTTAVGVALALTLPASHAIAADLPPIKVTASNPVPACATPGRMMVFLRSRNESLDSRLEKIAVEYMRRGEELGLRWDYASGVPLDQSNSPNFLVMQAAGAAGSR